MSTLTLQTETAPLAEPTATGQAVRAAGLGRSIDERAILQDITLDIPLGSFTALLGANGAGKSTLLGVLAMLQPATAGSLTLFGERISRPLAHLRARIGMIGHQPMLYRDLTVRENLHFFGRLYRIADLKAQAARRLEQVGLSGRADDPVKTLSRGMTQRAAIARALMHDPQLLLADEPFAGLDVPSAHAVARLLADLHAQGRTILLAHHNIDEALGLAQRVILLRHGRMVLDAPAAETGTAHLKRELIRS